MLPLTRILPLIVLVVGLLAPMRGHAQTLPICSDRVGYVTEPMVTLSGVCLERVVRDDSAGGFAFTGMAFAPDGTLVVARPLRGQVLTLTDTDGDALPDSPQVLLTDLDTPNSLLWAGDALYIAGGASVYRWQDNTLTTLIDDLPTVGGWNGGLALWRDRLFVGVGAPCAWCAFDPDQHALILSVALDGTDRRIEARGVRQPLAMGIYADALWFGDSVWANAPYPDEVNRLERGAHYGFPYCAGANNTPTQLGEWDCTATTAPIFTLASQASPIALLPYTGDAFPQYKGRLLVLLAGAPANRDAGYELLSVLPNGDDPAQFVVEPIMPVSLFVGNVPSTYDPQTGYRNPAVQDANRISAGFYPHRVLGLAIHPQGWIFLSTSNGIIYALRNL